MKLYLICSGCGASWVGFQCWQCRGEQSARHTQAAMRHIMAAYEQRVADAKLGVKFDADESARLLNG